MQKTWVKRLAAGAVLVIVAASAGWYLSQPRGTVETAAPAADREVSGNDRIKGPETAVVTLIEYGDFQCPSCGSYYPLLKQLSQEFPDELRIVFRNFPLVTIHKNAFPAALAAEAAGKQGKFWEMHDLLFEKQQEWSEVNDIEITLSDYAGSLGLDKSRFESDYKSRDVNDKVVADITSGNNLKVTGTPTFYVNGSLISLPNLDQFRTIINGEIAKAPKPTGTEVHEHFDVAVYVDGRKQDFSGDRFQEKHPSIHFHDNNGEVAHIHALGTSIGQFVESLGIDIKIPNQVIINGSSVQDGLLREAKNLDRIIIVSGDSTFMAGRNWENFVTDKACIYSETCPERGTPPTENCVGGVGTDCE